MLDSFTVPTNQRVLVGLATGDDSGVYRLTDEIALVQTVDMITPVVDDPYTFGQIAADGLDSTVVNENVTGVFRAFVDDAGVRNEDGFHGASF